MKQNISFSELLLEISKTSNGTSGELVQLEKVTLIEVLLLLLQL